MSRSVKEVIILTAEYYGRQLSAGVLGMYAEDLSDLDPEACVQAYTQWRRDPKNKTFPLPAQIREIVNPGEFIAVESQAREIAGRICGAIPKFGYNNSRAAMEFIGPEGWAVVQNQGGWDYLCREMGLTLNPTSFQAQVRDQLEGSLRYGRAAVEKAIGVLPERRSGSELQSIGELAKKLIGGDKHE